MKRRNFYSYLITTGLLISSACSLLGNSPSGVLKAFYTAANEGKYSKAEGYLSSDTLTTMKGTLGALGGGTKRILDQMTKDGTIEKIEIVNKQIRGDGATVDFKLHYKDGSTLDGKNQLIKQNGEWKLRFL